MIPMKDVVTLEEAVWVDPDRMSGAPCFRGSRLPVEQLFDWLADGVPLDDFVEEFRIDRRAAEAVLRAASARFSDRNVETTADSTPVPSPTSTCPKRRFADIVAHDPTLPVGEALTISNAPVGRDEIEI